ncbi:MAG: anti-sigma factor [Actinomycetes bacterium]
MRRGNRIDEYLLGDLTAVELKEIEGRASEDPAVRREIEDGKAVVAVLSSMTDTAWSPPEPPPLALDLGRAEPVAQPDRRRRQRQSWFDLTPRFAAVCAASLIAVGIGGTIAVQQLSDRDPGGPTVRLASVSSIDPQAAGAVKLSPDGKTATVTVSGLKPTDRDRYYEMWLLNSNRDLVSAGGFQVGSDGRAKVTVPMPASMDDYRYFDISLEKAKGDPGHSGTSVVRSSALT